MIICLPGLPKHVVKNEGDPGRPPFCFHQPMEIWNIDARNHPDLKDMINAGTQCASALINTDVLRKSHLV